MPTVHVMTGLPGSGKTTLARQLGCLRLNLDDYRAMLGNPRKPELWTHEHEKIACAMFIRSMVDCVDGGRDVVLDNTHLRKRLPERYRRALAVRPVTFKVHDLTDVSAEDCIKRDAVRPRPVGPDVILKMNGGLRSGNWKLTEEWLNEYTSYFSRIDPYTPDPTLPPAAVFDIDGTLALSKHRGPYDFEKCETDEPNLHVIDALFRCAYAGLTIVLLSGRKSEVREHTIRWLDRYGIPHDNLFMRPTDDNRPDFQVKSELFEKHVRGVWDVKEINDDRDQVVDLWRLVYNLPCNQVNYGAF